MAIAKSVNQEIAYEPDNLGRLGELILQSRHMFGLSSNTLLTALQESGGAAYPEPVRLAAKHFALTGIMKAADFARIAGRDPEAAVSAVALRRDDIEGWAAVVADCNLLDVVADDLRAHIVALIEDDGELDKMVSLLAVVAEAAEAFLRASKR